MRTILTTSVISISSDAGSGDLDETGDVHQGKTRHHQTTTKAMVTEDVKMSTRGESAKQKVKKSVVVPLSEAAKIARSVLHGEASK